MRMVVFLTLAFLCPVTPLWAAVADQDNQALVVRTWGSLRIDGNPVGNAVDVSASDGAVIVRLADGGVRAWGKNTWARVDLPPDLPPATQVAGGCESFGIVTEGGRVIRWGKRPLELNLSSGKQQVRTLAPNYILLEDGRVLGRNNRQIGNNITAIAESTSFWLFKH